MSDMPGGDQLYRHFDGERLVCSVFPKAIEEGTWRVGPFTKVVARKHECSPESSCNMKCRECNACRESYTCSCLDYREEENLCKHVHAVCQFLKRNSEDDAQLDSESSSSPGDLSDVSDPESHDDLKSRMISDSMDISRMLFLKYVSDSLHEN